MNGVDGRKELLVGVYPERINNDLSPDFPRVLFSFELDGKPNLRMYSFSPNEDTTVSQLIETAKGNFEADASIAPIIEDYYFSYYESTVRPHLDN